MLYVGLSGGIGSGKSTVSARLTELGAVVIDADRLARDVVERGSAGLAEIAERFGTSVLLDDGSLNRPALGAIVFADEEARRDLEAITHPRVQHLTEQRRRAASREAIVVHDVPLLVEGGLAPDHHLTVIVDVAAETRVERIVRDRGMDPGTARARIAAQATDAQRYAVADVVLDNNATREELLEQVDVVWRERLSPYNDNLLAGHPSSGSALTARSGAAGRSVERVRRQLARSSLSGRARELRVVADDVIEMVVAARPKVDGELLSALSAAGFVVQDDETVFACCDPSAPLTLWVRTSSD